jgi:DNA (cytosine-5)-methyltransferase 1
MSPPCQDLSIIGGKAGLDGEKSKYFFDAVRVIRGLRDRGWNGILLMEQVPAILSATGNQPAPMARILRELLKLGPLDLGWRVFNGRFCGVPQSRRRVFIALDFGGFRIHKILCDARPGTLLTAKGRISRVEDPRSDAYPALATQHPRYTGNPDSLALVARSPERYARPETIVACLLTREPYRGNRNPGNVVPCLTTKPPIGATDSFKLTLEQDMALRWRTPLEHERLMGLPDDWTRWGIDEKGRTIEMSDAARYHMAGNGVVAPIAEHIALNILECGHDAQTRAKLQTGIRKAEVFE